MFKKTWMTLLLIVFAGFALRVAYAKPGFMNSFNTTYPTSLLINNCMVCHAGSPPDEDNLNRYGNDFDNNHHNFGSIESRDSDRDGYSNIAEISAGTLPGDSTSYPGSLTSGGPSTAPTVPAAMGPWPPPSKTGRSAAQVQNAINNNVGGMSAA